MSQPKTIQQVFVYGTLLSQFDNPMSYYLSQHAQLVGLGRINADLYDGGDFPLAVLDGESQFAVQGEIYAVNPESYKNLLQFLDSYEGYHEENRAGSLFTREAVPVHIAKGQEIECWVYIFNKSAKDLPRVKSGNWLEHLMSQGKRFY
jgi:gamma-glutamylcyclotransferase (GGCT)/AIG2-like uncharacterized protein YtfP